jgi:hypothetical protein
MKRGKKYLFSPLKLAEKNNLFNDSFQITKKEIKVINEEA